MQNVEFKAELRDPEIAEAVCRRLEAQHIGHLDQTDTYYKVPSGRLKKRECVGEPVEWIFYDRPDRITPKLSRFTIYTRTEALKRFGTQEMPVWVVVRKRRNLYLLGGMRIHLDEVEVPADAPEDRAEAPRSSDLGVGAREPPDVGISVRRLSSLEGC